jgi:hypothetical protein
MGVAMKITFDFNPVAMVANFTLASFERPFPTCVAEPWTFDASTAVAYFPNMNSVLHTSPDCMVLTLQHAWITNFTLHVTGPDFLVLKAGAYAMALGRE